MTEPQQVNDRPAETGIKVGNILQTLILAAILWVGSSIEQIKSRVAEVTAFQMVNTEKIENVEARVVRLENDRNGV